MKTELVNFVDSLSPEVFSYNLELDEGLYILVDLDDDGKLLNFKKGVYKKKNNKKEEEKDKKKSEPQEEIELSFSEKNSMNENFVLDDIDWKKSLDIQVNIQPVSPAKIFNSDKKIFGASCSGFALSFNKKNLYDNKVFRKDEVNVSLIQYFKGAGRYIKEENENHTLWFHKFKSFCCNSLIPLLFEMKEFIVASENFKVNVFYNEPTLSDFQLLYEPYVTNSVFNKDEYKSDPIGEEKIIYNIADSLSSFNPSKTFLKHKTAPFEFNLRVNGEEAKKVWQFFNLRSRILPNPLPIFIDYKELNDEVVKIINEDKKIGYKEILRKLFESPNLKSDLGNYYLLFFLKGEIVDLDLVPSFQYEVKNMSIEEVFPLGGTQKKVISNIFEFEREVVSKIFDGVLVSTFEDGGLTVRYFFDFADKQSKNLLKGLIDNLKRKNKNFYNLLPQVLKYRKAFYDYIYKAKKDTIQSPIFHDIMLKGVLDDLRVSTINNDKEYDIKTKLNIWFSLYYYFDNPQNQNNMVQEQLSLLEQTRKIGQDDNEKIKTDTEFAFAVGQLVRYLLSKSEVGDRTHALLEPFLQKSDIVQLKLAIARAFDTYKHAIAFYKGDTRYTFDRLMDNVMNYPHKITNLKELLPYILGGYFAESVFKKQIEQQS